MRIASYVRVSTQRQGQSGLGLQAQRDAVEIYRSSNDAEVISEFTEIESGKRCNRPEIRKAIELAKKSGATLVVAKLDRLARNVAFTATLMDSGVEFVALDNLNASRFTIHLYAALAEQEALQTSQRTKNALKVAKAKGIRLGNPTPIASATRGRESNAARAAEYAATVLPLAIAKRKAGKTLQEIAHYLTGSGVLTRRGKAWTPKAVSLLLDRAA